MFFCALESMRKIKLIDVARTITNTNFRSPLFLLYFSISEIEINKKVDPVGENYNIPTINHVACISLKIFFMFLDPG